MEKRLPNDRLAGALQRLYAIGGMETLAHFWQGEPKILYHLYFRQDREVNPSALSEALGVTRARITSILSSLREKGLIHMRTSDRDRRRVIVELSEEGQKKVEQECRQIESHMQRLRRGLGEDQVEQLLSLLEQAIGLLQEGTDGDQTGPDPDGTPNR